MGKTNRFHLYIRAAETPSGWVAYVTYTIQSKHASRDWDSLKKRIEREYPGMYESAVKMQCRNGKHATLEFRENSIPAMLHDHLVSYKFSKRHVIRQSATLANA